MKTTKYIFFAGIFLISGISLLKAQEASDTIINRNVTVEREFRPVIQDAGKMNVYPDVSAPQLTGKSPQYNTVHSNPLNVDQNIHYLPSAAIRIPQPRYNEGFLRLGVGTGFSSLADFAYPLVRNENTKLDANLNHYGFYNSKAHVNTQAALNFTKQFNAFDFYIGAGGSHEFFKYYGKSYNQNSLNDLTESDLQNFGQNNLWRFQANAGIHNSLWEDGWRYGADLGYNLYHSGVNRIMEHQVNLKGSLSTELFQNRVGLNITSSNQFYNSSSLQSYYVFSLNPHYVIERNRLDLKLGFKTYFSINQGRGFSIMPDITFDWRFAPKFAAVYAGITGDYKINTLSAITRENLYVLQGVPVDDTYSPFDIFAGLKIKPVNGLLIDGYIDYQIINNQYFFSNMTSPMLSGGLYYTNVFVPTYSKANVFKVGGRISYTYFDKFDVQLNGAYNKWDVADYDYAWYKPSWEIGLKTSVKLFSSLNIYADANFSGGRYALLRVPVKLDPVIDINLGVDYSLFKWMSVFVKVNNLTNNKHHIWYGYEAQGIHFMGGVVFDF